MRSRILGAAVVFCISIARSHAALACGATAPPEYVLQDASPRGLALINQPIVVRLQAVEGSSTDQASNPGLILTTRGNPDLYLPLRAIGRAPKLVWVPIEPLQPDTEYDVTFDPDDLSGGALGWSFTTGQDKAPPLTLAGELAITFEQGMDTICASAGTCSCAETKQIAVTKARVRIPRAEGGFPDRVGAVYLTDDQPFDFTVPSKSAPEPYHGRNVSLTEYADLEDPTLGDVLITVPEEELRYRPCFAFQASDERGDVATAQPLCVDFPEATAADGSGAPTRAEDSSANPAGEPPNRGAHTSEGCSFARTTSAGGAWLVSLGLLSRRRRRRA